LRFNPGEEKSFVTDLQTDFGHVPLDSVLNMYGAWGPVCLHIPVGKYSVYFKKYAGVSNAVSFEVIKPEGQDMIDLNVLKDAFTPPLFNKGMRIDRFYDFLINYPNSNYYELGLQNYSGNLSLYYTTADYINLIGIADKWFEKDTESELTKQIVRALGAVYKTKFSDAKEKVKTFLNKTILAHPNTVASRWSQSYLDILNK
jgi:hypothetical protein